jgi:hypothetical protein
MEHALTFMCVKEDFSCMLMLSGATQFYAKSQAIFYAEFRYLFMLDCRVPCSFYRERNATPCYSYFGVYFVNGLYLLILIFICR